MGEWYDYKIRFANNEGRNLADEMVAKGIAEKKMVEHLDGDQVETFWINLKKMSYEFANGYHDDNLEQISIGLKGDGSVSYVNKWVPDDRLAFAISKHFEDPLFVSREYTGGTESICWYEKDGDVCTKDGRETKGQLLMVNPKLVKEVRDGFRISIPIGNENARWGSFTLPKENVAYNTFTYEDAETHEMKTGLYGVSVFFDKEKMPISFRGRVVEMDVSDIKEKFYQSKKDYRNDIIKPVILEVPAGNVTKKTNNQSEFFIIRIPCTKEHSSNEEMSFAVYIDSVRDAGNGNYAVNIGEKGKSHKVYYKNEEKTTTIEIRNSQIANIFREGIAEHPERYDANVRNQNHVSEETYRTLPYVDEEMQATYGPRNNVEQEEVVFDEDAPPFN